MSYHKAIAIVGMGAILPDANDAPTFWKNILSGMYSIRDVSEDRWRTDLYYDPDPTAMDKTYTKIGAWVRGYQFEPLKWGIPIPPKVLAVMDQSQQWAIAAARQALGDYGYPQRSLNPERVAVILGNAMGGEYHYRSTLRILAPEYASALADSPAFRNLPKEVQQQLLEGMTETIRSRTPNITEDTMPGELSNIIAGRIANVFNFSGANFTTDAACASSLAAAQAAMEGLNDYQYDAVLTGGVDRSMGPESFVKFCKIGALSPDGSRPYSDGANGFVMGEGAAIFLLKRLADAERDGDKIYAVIRGVGSSSDGKGKGITAPNPAGQLRAVERAWKNAGVSPASVGMIEGHGTSTKVGDVVEVNSMNSIFGTFGLPVGHIALGSVKSNIGHLKSAAGAAGMLKTAYALYEKLLPPSINFVRPNPNIDFAHMPLAVNTTARPWEKPSGEIRRAGVSSFGFGGTNFHLVMEEYVPGLAAGEPKVFQGVEVNAPTPVMEAAVAAPVSAASTPRPYRELLYIGGKNSLELKERFTQALEQAKSNSLPASKLPTPVELTQPERLVIDFDNAADLLKKSEKVLKTLENETSGAWNALTAQGVYRGSGKAGKVAFLFPGQGSQYINMLRDLCEAEPVVQATFDEADRIMTPILGRTLTSYIYVEGDEETLKKAELDLRNTKITQPALLTANVAMLRLLAKFGFLPDMVIGHSLGEYGALVASGVLTFTEALEVVSARGREMSKLVLADNGAMAAVPGPLAEVERILKGIAGYVVIANINSPLQSVIAGETAAVEAAVVAFQAINIQATRIPVSHAFHSRIVAPASVPLRQVITRMNIQAPRIPIAANVTGELYPSGREDILDLLAQQVASPVQFIKGIETLYAQGGRVFVESGPKRVLSALGTDILKDRQGIALLATNHPRKGGVPSFSEALCGLYAAGVGAAAESNLVEEKGGHAAVITVTLPATPAAAVDGRLPLTGSVVISGAGLGLPGRSRSVFHDDNILDFLKGTQRIEPLSDETRRKMLEKRVTRLVKSEAGAIMQHMDDLEQTVKLGGQRGKFNLVEEFGIPADRVEACDIATQLAIAAGIEALRDAGIPLVMNYKQTSMGGYLPDRWKLPEALADETGIIFASAFPGLDQMAQEAERYYAFELANRQAAELKNLLALVPDGATTVKDTLLQHIAGFEAELAAMDYHFDRRYVFRVLTMGHSQFAEQVGARGPNTAVNAACASTTHAVAIAEDWIRNGRCRRVLIIAGDDITSGSLPAWIGTSMMASGAATIEGDLRRAALPFDRRRNGLIMGMGAAALVVESEDAVRERGMRAISELLSSHIANSAFHGTRLNIEHVAMVMDRLVSTAESRFGLRRADFASQMVFVSHETYTPARGGSAAAEICALRQTFGEQANRVIIANTKGYTGHTMGVGVEDVVAVKALEYGLVPPIAHYDENFEPDPDLGDLNLSRGGQYDPQFALRLGAGFGSQIAMTLMRRVAGVGTRIDLPAYTGWLAAVAGYDKTELEVTQRTLRIRDQGIPAHRPAGSKWQYGQGPTLWAARLANQVNAAPLAAAPAPVVHQHQDATQVVTPAAASLDDKTIQAFILGLVSEKTGYPVEMLDVDLDLEADLGIDTVKQAELFLAVRTHYGIPRREDLRLADYNTLSKVVGFVRSGLAPSTVPVAQAVTPAPVAAAGFDVETIKSLVLNMVSEKTGYPVEMLDLDLDLEADLGIDTVKQAELFLAVRTHYGIPRREDLRLADYNTLSKVVGFIQDGLAGGTVATPAAAVHTSTPMPAAATQTPAAAATVSAAGSDLEAIKTYVLSMVSEKTGYPVEMLDLELDLEADLGIDTVKQAELFASIRMHYGVARREDLRLAEYNTLAKVIQFFFDAVKGGVPAESQPAAAAPVTQTADAALPTLPAAVSSDTDEIKAFVLGMVSEKTGYPADMLDPDLDLEADLGIDTVKQAELFASIRTHYDIPRREDLRLSDYNTLTRVIQFMKEAMQSKAAAQAPVVQPEEANEAAGEPETKVSIQRRVPVPVLRPRLELCLPTRASLNLDTRVVVVSAQDKTADTLARKLRSRKVQVFVLDVTKKDSQTKLDTWLADGTLHGLYFLTGLDVEAPLSKCSFETWQAEQEKRVFALATLAKRFNSLTFLMAATRMGGLLGTGGTVPSPLGGALSGLVKALAWERPEMLAKVVDFEATATPADMAGCLFEETLHDPGAVEIGYEGDQRFSIAMSAEALCSKTLDYTGSVFLVSGGSGGITAPVVVDLAKATQGHFYLLGRTPLPDANDPELAMLAADLNLLKKELAQRITANGGKATPAAVDQKLSALERASGTLKAIQAVKQAGGQAQYLVCDVSDPAAVQQAVSTIMQAEGRVDVLIHAAGQERSRKLESKSEDEFRQVFNVKANGFFNLWKALESSGKLPKAVVSFTSVAGRFGNSGQTDYAAANDLLCKLTTAINQRYPEVQALALDWGAWAEVGMASRGSIPRLMRFAGIEMMPFQAAAPLVYAELCAGTRGEVVLSGSLGQLSTPGNANGGLDIEAANRALTEGSPVHVMLSRATGLDLNEGILLEADLDPTSEPFLKDHAMNGVPLLPGVMGIEGFTVAAMHVATALGASKAGFRVTHLEDIHFLKPFKFFRDEPRRVTWKAQVRREASGLVASVLLESTKLKRIIEQGAADDRVEHFTGRVYLQPVDQPLQSAKVKPPKWNGAYTVTAEEIYRLYFHGPSFQVLEGVQRSGDTVLGKLRKEMPGLTSLEQPMITTPLLLELVLQTAGVWEAGATGIMALPMSIQNLTLYPIRPNGVTIYAEVQPVNGEDGMCFNARVVDAKGHLYLELSGYRTSPLANAAEAHLVAPFKALVAKSDQSQSSTP
jgi:malonyl CoA-acyl carrier protein transacylase